MIYHGIRCLVVLPKADGWNNTTREPTTEEGRKIARFVDELVRRTGYPPIGGGPVPDVGDVVFGVAPSNGH